MDEPDTPYSVADRPGPGAADGHDPRSAFRHPEPAQRLLGGVLPCRGTAQATLGVCRGLAAGLRRHPVGGRQRLVYVAGLLDAAAGLRLAVAGRSSVRGLAA